ncbi:MAG TPA: iron-containing redox enzyme family protein [Solirubrobacteraceae bacterium]|jgi:pyrroloquinoline-quinone synthase|nr:iron-containing redox enzyme family protein [Solirubrobacteraceae bacterium]
MDVIARIDDARRECNVLEHPFYQRWSAGELSIEELGFYAGEYRHAVVALARASEDVAAKVGAEHRASLERHAAEERSHVALWDAFAAAAEGAAGEGTGEGAGGGTAARSPLGETLACARAWTAGEDALERLAVLYAIEASQPEIAKTKLAGLTERYGYRPEGPAVEYFSLHATLDVEHARQASELIAELMSDDKLEARAQADRMVERATAALRGNWELLDGVDRRFARVG